MEDPTARRRSTRKTAGATAAAAPATTTTTTASRRNKSAPSPVASPVPNTTDESDHLSDELEDDAAEDEGASNNNVVVGGGAPRNQPTSRVQPLGAAADTHAFKGLVPLPESRVKKIATRAAAAFCMMGGFLFIVFRGGHLAVCLLVVILQTLIFRELVALRYVKVKTETEGELRWFRTIQWAWYFVAILYSYGSSYLKAPMGALETLRIVKLALRAAGIVDELSFLQAVSFGLYSIVFTATVLTFRKGLYRIQLIQLTWTALTLGVVVAQMKFAVYMVHEGLFWFLYPVSLVVANDTFAYFAGMAFGRRFVKGPLIQLSPNKTWEGFVGGLIGTVVYAVVGARVWGSFDFLRCRFDELHAHKEPRCDSNVLFEPNPNQTWLPTPIQRHAVFYALFASIVAPFGGFFASAIKRAFKIKDFDSLIPGHGGITDRMDCQLIMSLFSYVYYTSFIASLHLKLPLEQIWASIETLEPEEQLRLLGKLEGFLASGGGA